LHLGKESGLDVECFHIQQAQAKPPRKQSSGHDLLVVPSQKEPCSLIRITKLGVALLPSNSGQWEFCNPSKELALLLPADCF